MKNFLKRTWVEINLDNAKHNFMQIKNKIGDKKLMCVIKADAYGHGAVNLALEYAELGADYFAVSNLEEALQLRNHDIKTPILILGYTPTERTADLIKFNITQAAFSFEYASLLSKEAQKLNTNLKVHIKLDTGMSRIGLLCQNDEQINYSVENAVKTYNLPNLLCEGVFTHFSVSDSGKSEEDYTKFQFNNFVKTISILESKGLKFKIKHCANSGAIIDYPEFHLDMVRAGIILYGLKPSSTLKNSINLKPVMELKTIISHIKTVPAGTFISYGKSYKTEKPMVLATVPIGYADGFSRKLSNKGSMIVNNKIAPIIGRVCMDQTIIDITDIPGVKVNDIVSVFGNSIISADTISNLTDTINYEVVCLISKRVPRVYYKNNKIVDSISCLF